MKIIAIGRNYINHAKELKNPIPENPIFFMKPDTSIVLNNRPFFYPDFSKDIHHEIEVVVRINRLGKNIEERFAHRYYEEIALGVDFTARDLQQKAKEKGLPWEIAKAFDGAAPLSDFIKVSEFKNIQNISFHLNKNGETVQKGNTIDMIFSVNKLIAYVSQFITLKIGDLLFTGTPEGVGPVQINDHLEGYVEDQKMLDFFIK